MSTHTHAHANIAGITLLFVCCCSHPHHPPLHPSVLLLTLIHTQPLLCACTPSLEQTMKQRYCCSIFPFSSALPFSSPLCQSIFNFITLSLSLSPSLSLSLSLSLAPSPSLMPLAFSYIFLYPAVFPLSLPISVQAQDFYVEMKWEFTSWGESSHCITPVGKAVQHRPVRTNHVIVLPLGLKKAVCSCSTGH